MIRTYVEKPPVLFIVAGQSNAVGSGGAPSIEVADYAGQYWDWSKVSAPVLRPLRDPVYRSYNKSACPHSVVSSLPLQVERFASSMSHGAARTLPTTAAKTLGTATTAFADSQLLLSSKRLRQNLEQREQIGC